MSADRRPSCAGKRPHRRPDPQGLEIVFEDDYLVVVAKVSGLLTIATERDRERTAYRLLMDYVRKGNPRSRQRVFIVHRLDRDTSGVLVFAKTEEVKRALQDNWDAVSKTYLAVVHGIPPQSSGRIQSYLAENAAFRVYSTQDPSKGRLALTEWRKIKTMRSLSLLEIGLLTGRKNQIRVHLADAGFPIVGDRKYGRANDSNRILALHARSLAFTHPVTGISHVFEAPVPSHIVRLTS